MSFTTIVLSTETYIKTSLTLIPERTEEDKLALLTTKMQKIFTFHAITYILCGRTSFKLQL